MNKITYLCFVILFCLSSMGFSQSSEIQRVRIDFVSPLGYARHLLLAFTPDGMATDGFDYGYDAINIENFPDDLNWIINDKRYIIQGVGAFENSKFYPFGMFLTNSGQIKIRLMALENFETPIEVYIYDNLLNQFTSINNFDYTNSMTQGEYLNRFYITFSNNPDLVAIAGSNNALAVNENEINKTTLNYLNRTKELLIKTNSFLNLRSASLYDTQGRQLIELTNLNSDTVKIPLSGLMTNGPLIVNLMAEDGKQLNKQFIAGHWN